MSDPRILSSEDQRTRRNIVKIGAMLGAAALTRVARARAAPVAEPLVFRCLLRGTGIQTTAGDCKVEDLAIGDPLPTVFSGIRPIQWIGRYPIKKSDPSRPWPKESLPVRVARSAIAPDVPRADIFVTGWHCLLIDGLLIPAVNLVNGTTITLHEAPDVCELEFFHIKLENHDVIYAEGAPVETLPSVDEAAVNFAEYFRMYGMPGTEGTRCAPFVFYGRRGELKSRVRSAISPWFDRREQIDVIRDRLEERAIALTQESEPSI